MESFSHTREVQIPWDHKLADETLLSARCKLPKVPAVSPPTQKSKPAIVAPLPYLKPRYVARPKKGSRSEQP